MRQCQHKRHYSSGKVTQVNKGFKKFKKRAFGAVPKDITTPPINIIIQNPYAPAEGTPPPAIEPAFPIDDTMNRVLFTIPSFKRKKSK